MKNQRDSTKVFSEYTVPKAVATLAIPSMLGMLINVIYNLADTFFVGQTNDANQVAAVSVSMPLFLLLVACGNLFGVGGCAFISRSLGEGKKDKIKTISSFCVYGSLIVAVIIAAIFIIFKKSILYSVGASDNTIQFASDYLFYIALGTPFTILAITISNIIRGEGAAKESMIGMILGQVVNIILDPIFILKSGSRLFGLLVPFGLDLGVKGAAIATVLGNFCSVAYFVIYFLRGKSILSITPKRFKVRNGIAKGVLSVGAPASINNLLMSISSIVINIFLVKYGDNAIAAMGVANKANMLVVMLQIGLAQGVQPLIGYCYGSKNFDKLKKSMNFSMMCNVILGGTITIIYYIFRRQIIEIFINDQEVINYGVKMLTAFMSPGLVIGIMFVIMFSFQGMGKGVQSLILTVSRQGFIYFPLLFILDHFVGLNGIIWSQATADFVCVIISVLMFIHEMKKTKKVFDNNGKIS